MGVIFTAEAIAKGDIPLPGAHELAGRFILGQLFKPEYDSEPEKSDGPYIGKKGVESALIYGSTALGTADLRSDVDVLVNYSDECTQQALSLIRTTFYMAETRFKVPVEAQVLPTGALADPLKHSIDPLFAVHLSQVQQQDEPRWSYNWPLDEMPRSNGYIFEKDSARIRAIAVRYASGKSRQFTRAIVGYRGELDLQVFQRSLELPSAIGRKVLVATIEIGEVELPETGDKQAMHISTLNRLEQLTQNDDKQVVSDQRSLIELDGEYSHILTQTIDGSLSLLDYSMWLDKNYLHALEMAQNVSHRWAEIVSDKVLFPRAIEPSESHTTFDWSVSDDITY